ncbi:hypothetical protein ACFOSC_00395 [Streptantibioticus rubrisoli]|uniref:Uncharacterized protein n=1 Tax=Streptantibioticus rubrisoli TaxID=1387313 RepID=A0ABT1PID8_9ACTN|nr:hypothetical protein [Streptantibioticus rubrisoli]MCQ4045126.1 hypothetical protein [Streptantibioticus rubrisoli]
MTEQSDGFAEELWHKLVEVAAEAGPPPADLPDRVRARVAASRRRRTGVVVGCVAACAVGTLTFGLLWGGWTASGHDAQAAAHAPSARRGSGAPADPAPAESPSAVPGAALPSGILPASLVKLWDVASRTAHTDVRVLHQDILGHRLLMLVQGRESSGLTHVALLSTALNGGNGPTDAGTYVLMDHASPGSPSAPVAVTFAVKSPSPRTIVVLPDGCAGQLRVTQEPGGERIGAGRYFAGELVLAAPVVSEKQTVVVGCQTRSGNSTSVLRFTGSANANQSGMVSLYTGD